MALAGSVTFDMREVEKLATDLRADSRRKAVELRNETQQSARRIRDDWRRTWSAIGAHVAQLPKAVTFDTRYSASGVEAEIGPDKSLPQGALGNIIEFGTSRNAPIPGGGPALVREEPRLVTAVERIAGGLLK